MSLERVIAFVLLSIQRRSLIAACVATGLILGLASTPAAKVLHAQPLAPTATLVGVPGQVLIGEPFEFAVKFEPGGGDFGYGPFIDVMVDHKGADGIADGGPCDGLTIDVQSITIAAAGGSCDGAACACRSGEGEASECPDDATNSPPLPIVLGPAVQATQSCPGPVATHPWGPAFVPLAPPGLPGLGQLVTIALPFGSFAADQPPVIVRMQVTVHSFADVDAPLEIRARAGYRYSSTAMAGPPNPSPADSVWDRKFVTPVVATLDKGYTGPEIEVATGPNFPYPMRYPIAANVADGQTVTDLRLRDYFSPMAQFDGSASSNMGWSALGRDVLAQSASWTSPPEPSLDVGFYIARSWTPPDPPGPAVPVLNPNSCEDVTISNVVRMFGNWTPLDPRDGPDPVTLTAEAIKDIYAQCVAIQKTMEIWLDNGAPGLSPGDYLRYTLDFQFTDYHAFGDIVIVDELSDGQEFWGSWPVSAPRLTVNDRTGIKTQVPTSFFPSKAPAVATLDESVTSCGLRGGTRLEFPVSEAMRWLPATSSALDNGIVTGGHAITPPSTVPATGQIVFYARVRETMLFPNAEPGDDNVVKHDPIGNCVYLRANRYNVAQPAGGPATYAATNVIATDKSGTVDRIVPDTVEKSVYARNGVPGSWTVGSSGLPQFAAGDAITYRITKVIPTGDVEQLTIEDWFPLPVTPLAGAGMTFTPTVCGIPLAGAACLGPWDSVTAGLAPPPVFSADATHNSIFWDYGDFHHNHPSQEVVIDLLVTLEISDKPFADGLHLTNVVQECEANSQGDTYCQVAMAQFELTEPLLKITKGVVATDNGDSAFSPKESPPVPFPGNPVGCPKFTPPIITGISYDLNNADAGDTLTFAIVVENLGSGLYGAFDVTLSDVLPLPWMTHVPGTLCVSYGTGTAVATIPPLAPEAAAFAALFGPGLRLEDPGPTKGALDPPGGVPGRNLVVVTFDVKLNDSIPVGCHTNEAHLVRYATAEDGPDFVTAGFTPPFSDTSVVCVGPKIVKEIVTTSELHTEPKAAGGSVAGQPDLAIGEIVRYKITVDVPEGSSPALTIKDFLPADLVPLPATLNTTVAPPITAINNPPLVTPETWTCEPDDLPPAPLELSFGAVANPPNGISPETITVEFNALVCNTTGNNNLEVKTNLAEVWVGGVMEGTSSVLARIVEPRLTIEKRLVTDPLDLSFGSGQTIVYEIIATNIGSTTAFDAVITDPAPPCLEGPVHESAVGSSGVMIVSPDYEQGLARVRVPSIPPGGAVTMRYTSTLKPDCRDCEKLVNTATVTWTSLPEAGTASAPDNGTGSTTPGGQGDSNGERDGSGAHNDYRATSKPVSLCGSICGQKYYDLNSNGSNDGEPSLAGWQIQATAGGTVAGQATTGVAGSPDKPNGWYCMNVLPGTYAVSEVMTPAQVALGWIQTAPTGPWSVTVGVGQEVEGIDFGNDLDGGCEVKICGIKFEDLNGNGVQDGNEKGLEGWEIVIDDSLGNTKVVTTDSDGKYCVTLTGTGSFFISETVVPGFTQTYPPNKDLYRVVIECEDGQPMFVHVFLEDDLFQTPVALDEVDFGNKPDVPIDCEVTLPGTLSAPAPLLAWGNNLFGQVTGGPPSIPTGKFWPGWYTAVAAGGVHSLAIEASLGSIVQWGDPVAGSPPPNISAKAIAAGATHSLAIGGPANQLWAWGNNLTIGAGTPNVPCAAALGTVPPCLVPGSWRVIAAGVNFSLAVDATDKIFCWGDPDVCTFVPATTPAPVVELAAGAQHAVARTSTDTVYCWGEAWICGGTPTASTKFLTIGAGAYHSLGIVDDSGPPGGPLLQWGTYAPVDPPTLGNDYQAVAGGPYLGLALRQDGSLVRWGKNSPVNRIKTLGQPAGKRFTAISAAAFNADDISHVVALLCPEYTPPVGECPDCTLFLPVVANTAVISGTIRIPTRAPPTWNPQTPTAPASTDTPTPTASWTPIISPSPTISPTHTQNPSPTVTPTRTPESPECTDFTPRHAAAYEALGLADAGSHLIALEVNLSNTRTSRLHVTNVGAGTANLHLSLFTAAGQVAPCNQPSLCSVSAQPGQLHVWDLADLVSGTLTGRAEVASDQTIIAVVEDAPRTSGGGDVAMWPAAKVDEPTIGPAFPLVPVDHLAATDRLGRGTLKGWNSNAGASTLSGAGRSLPPGQTVSLGSISVPAGSPFIYSPPSSPDDTWSVVLAPQPPLPIHSRTNWQGLGGLNGERSAPAGRDMWLPWVTKHVGGRCTVVSVANLIDADQSAQLQFIEGSSLILSRNVTLQWGPNLIDVCDDPAFVALPDGYNGALRVRVLGDGGSLAATAITHVDGQGAVAGYNAIGLNAGVADVLYAPVVHADAPLFDGAATPFRRSLIAVTNPQPAAISVSVKYTGQSSECNGLTYSQGPTSIPGLRTARFNPAQVLPAGCRATAELTATGGSLAAAIIDESFVCLPAGQLFTVPSRSEPAGVRLLENALRRLLQVWR
jgi:uncharacterized repeat protein (TIGR01451 family)